jgi:VWA domain-containing protein
MRTVTPARFIAGGALACALIGWLAPRGTAAPSDSPAAADDSTPPTQSMTVDLRGPLAVVTVTRILSSQRPRAATEESLDIALPDRAVLLSVELDDHGRWRTLAVDKATGTSGGSGSAAEPVTLRSRYIDALRTRGIAAKGDPYDDETTYRIRVARGAGGAAATAPASPVTVRYRFSALVEDTHGRLRLRFPPSPEVTPLPAEVSVVGPGLGDLEIAGVHTPLPGHASTGGGGVTLASTAPAAAAAPTSQTHVSTRSGWEISYTLSPSAIASAAAKDGPVLEGAAAVAEISPRESAVAFSVRARASGPPAAPGSVLFVIDRSRSVGMAGLAAEHDVAAHLLDLLAPTTRFDVLFFDRTLTRLFPMARTATRDATGSIESEMVPDRLANGTDLEGALRAAGEILRREASSFGPRALLAVLTDGALPETTTGARLDAAIGAVPGIDLSVAAIVVRPGDDDPIGPPAHQALTALAEARGGVERELRADDINDALPSLVEVLAAGGDVFSARVAFDKTSARLPGTVSPGGGFTGVVRVPGKLRKGADIAGVSRGHDLRAPLKPIPVDAAWLRPLAAGTASPLEARALTTPMLAALVEPVPHAAAPAPPAPVRGTMDRDVVRNTLSLAFMPRARACYQSRPGTTPAMRDLTGRVRMAIDLVRGEVMDARVESSTLDQPTIESCLRESAFALEVPRAYHNDESVTAVVNLVFRPRTPEKRRSAEDSFPIGAEIDLVLEELKKAEAAAAAH